MTTLTLTIKKKKLAQKLEEVAKKRFKGNTRRAASVLLERAIESEEELKTIRTNAEFSHFKAIGMWSDRDEMNDSVEWVNQLREKENLRTFL